MSFTQRLGCNMKRVGVAAACLVVTLAICCTAIAAGDDSNHSVMVDVRDARLGDVVLLLTAQSGAGIFINPDVANKKVTARAENLPLETALDLIVKATAGVDYWKDDKGNYVIGGQRPVEKVEPAVVEPPVFVPQPEPEPVEVAPKLKTETVKLQNLSPEEILVALNVLPTPKDFFGGKSLPVAAIIDEDHLRIDPVGTSTNPMKPIRLNDRTVPLGDSGSAFVDGAGRSATPDTGSPQFRPPTTGGTTTGGTTTRPPTQTGANNQQNLLPDGVQMVMPFAMDNSLIIRGTEEGIAEFKDIVHLLDIAPKQVMIKAEFIEVSTDDVKRFGIDWNINRLNQSFGTGLAPSGTTFYNLQTGNLTMALRAELTTGSGKTITAPIITTLNNEVGQIQIQRSIPYWTSTVVTPGTGAATTAYTVHELTVATGLSVLPRVNGDNTITLTMAPQVEDTGRIYKGPDGTEIPETRGQSLAIRRRVANGETIVCGGFIRKNDSLSIGKVPLLGDLPIIGNLFRTTDRSGQESELLIFITPTIIGEKAGGSSVGVSP